MFPQTNEFKNGLIAMAGGVFAFFFIAPALAAFVFFAIGLYFLFSGFATLYTVEEGDAPRASIPQTSSAPVADDATIADQIRSINQANGFKCPSCGAVVFPTSTKCDHCGSYLVDSAKLPKPEKWGDVEIGRKVQITHPEKGQLALSVENFVFYGELWQKKMRPDVPWTLTGNYFVGIGLSNGMVLLNWQNRFYLLEDRSPLTDMDINRDFAQPARKFAASNQTADVVFQYRNINWRMDDIGRFRIEYCFGDGIKLSPGAIGRFIHSSNKDQALIVEDYQSGGGGLDNVRQGFILSEKDIKF